jgi:predicted RND superfamily exporter protein
LGHLGRAEVAEVLLDAPQGLELRWGGLSYINVVWQDLMVSGMGKALAGSWVTVLIMMILLFRSIRLGILAMIPLTATILITYGYVGLAGRNYDMPIAVLSSLSLGLSVDFAIHFIQRTRDIFNRCGQDFTKACQIFFHEPAQALARNIVVIALGFVPMFFATLVPYVTVGAFFFGIMIISGGATFLIMPAVLSFYPARTIAGRGTAAAAA